MIEENWLSSSEKGRALDGGNDIEVNVVEQESPSTEISSNMSIKSFSNSSVASNFSAQPTKLSMLSIAIAEKNDAKKFRIYRPLNCEPSESTIYYRCVKCESLERKASGNARSKHYKPYVKTVRGKLIGNAHPEHHPGCHAVTKKIHELQEMDRVCRAKISASYQSLTSPQKYLETAVEESPDINVQPNYAMHKRSKRLSFKFDILNRDMNESGPSEIDYLLRFISEVCMSDVAEMAHYESIYSLGTSSSSSINYASLIVPEPDGMSVRIYDGDNKLADQAVMHYYCSKCDILYQKGESTRSALKVKDDLVIEYPEHHTECSPTALESLRELGDDLKNFCVAANRKIIPLKAVFEAGYNIFDESNECFPTDASNQQNWDTTVLDEGILINSASIPKLQEQRCFCRRLYEENMELYQEMLNSVAEIRSLISEMKRISGANSECFIEDVRTFEGR